MKVHTLIEYLCQSEKTAHSCSYNLVSTNTRLHCWMGCYLVGRLKQTKHCPTKLSNLYTLYKLVYEQNAFSVARIFISTENHGQKGKVPSMRLLLWWQKYVKCNTQNKRLLNSLDGHIVMLLYNSAFAHFYELLGYNVFHVSYGCYFAEQVCLKDNGQLTMTAQMIIQHNI